MLEPGFLFTLAAAGLGGVIWAVRVEGRVNGHDELFREREKQITERHEELQDRLTRIEAKLDSSKGPRGLPGPQGIPGLKGDTGPAGPIFQQAPNAKHI